MTEGLRRKHAPGVSGDKTNKMEQLAAAGHKNVAGET